MIISLIQTLFRIYYFLLLARIFLSWVPVNQYNEWVRILYKLTDPYLDIFRKFIPPIGMVDISPIAAFLVLGIIENLLYRALFIFMG